MASGIVILMKSTADLWQKSAQSFRSGSGLAQTELQSATSGKTRSPQQRNQVFTWSAGYQRSIIVKKRFLTTPASRNDNIL